ncbi:hypothetical protein [Streptomyces sp. AC627_RSS907]|uniref:hypothetical protein n=1 Tax=Streptomyces sp. AC627_RSS907 TaxID=2823684 RepID=UPI001C2369FD|nr:hypothetical protein [Streptomyces sp. AC627_RSS907]
MVQAQVLGLAVDEGVPEEARGFAEAVDAGVVRVVVRTYRCEVTVGLELRFDPFP